MNLHKKTYYTGYLNSNVKKYFKKEDDCFNLYGDGKFDYEDKITQPCYSSGGECLGNFTKTERYSKEEKEKLLSSTFGLNVVQINYDFHKINYYANTINEISRLEYLLENSDLIKNDIYCNQSRFEGNYVFGKMDGYLKRKAYVEPFDLVEMCYIGNSQRVTNRVNKRIYELDIKEYTKRKNKFIKNNPELEEQTELIYAHNIVYLMDFWNVGKDELFKMDIFKSTINKLNRKINYKSKLRR